MYNTKHMHVSGKYQICTVLKNTYVGVQRFREDQGNTYESF